MSKRGIMKCFIIFPKYRILKCASVSLLLKLALITFFLSKISYYPFAYYPPHLRFTKEA